nr:hypothetical protein [Vibrio furnissii]
MKAVCGKLVYAAFTP